MGDRVRVQFPVLDIYLGMHPATQVNSVWPSVHVDRGAMTTNQRAMMPCGWGVMAGMVRVWVAGETV